MVQGITHLGGEKRRHKEELENNVTRHVDFSSQNITETESCSCGNPGKTLRKVFNVRPEESALSLGHQTMLGLDDDSCVI